MEDPNKKESVADVLARMQAELSFDVQEFVEPGDVITKPADTPAPTPTPRTEDRAMELVQSADSALNAAEDDGDVASYMDNLLGRYGKDEAKPEAAQPQAKPEPKAEVKAAAKPEAEAVEPEEVVERPQLLSQHEYLPQKKAPEEQASIAAMRELAVHSARKAISDSVQKQRGMDASFRLTLGGLCSLLAFGAFYFAEGFFTVMGMLGIASVVGATAFLLNWQNTVRQKPSS